MYILINLIVLFVVHFRNGCFESASSSSDTIKGQSHLIVPGFLIQSFLMTVDIES